jgi:hypothetical protein
VDENENTGTYRVGRRIDVKTLVIALIVAGLVLAAATGYAGYLSGKLAAKDEIAVVKATTVTTKPAIDAEPVAKAAQERGVLPYDSVEATAPVSTAKVESLPASAPAGTKAVRLHTLRGDPKGNYDIADEIRETEDAFKLCAKVHNVALTLCVVKTVEQSCKGCNVKFAALAKTANDMTDEEAKGIADCFNRNMEIVGQTNAAEPAPLADFDGDCLAAK